MQLFYWGHKKNFGDDLNVWLWDELLPNYKEVHPDKYLVGVGSILDLAAVNLAEEKAIVIGAGGYSKDLRNFGPKSWDVRAVRGPITAKRMGLSHDKAVIDPATLIPLYFDFPQVQNGGVVFVPHWTSENTSLSLREQCIKADIEYVSPCGDSMSIVTKIASASLVIAESMHAAIIADSFGIPWHAVSTGNVDFNKTKWDDWGDSVGEKVIYRSIFPFSQSLTLSRRVSRKFFGFPVELPHAVNEIAKDNIARSFVELKLRKGQLSNRAILRRSQMRLCDILNSVLEDYFK